MVKLKQVAVVYEPLCPVSQALPRSAARGAVRRAEGLHMRAGSNARPDGVRVSLLGLKALLDMFAGTVYSEMNFFGPLGFGCRDLTI